jgi:hypothetical protein
MSVSDLLAAFRSLPPWSAADPESDSGPSGWLKYNQAARLAQAANPAELDQALLEFLNEAEGEAGSANESRLFLLSRFVFDLPAHAPAAQRRVFKGWINWPAPDSEGMVSLDWPVRFGPGGPSLLAAYKGSEGPRYGAVEDYCYLREHFGLRDLARGQPGR